jgi:hypothetical protein
MASERYGIYPAVLDGVTLNNLDSCNVSADVQTLVRRAGGDVPTTASALIGASNSVSLSSRDIHEILTNAGPTLSAGGLAVSTSGVFQYRQKGQTGSNHVTITSLGGFLYVTDFGAEQGSAEGADINMVYRALSVSGNAPLSINAAASITGTPAVNSSFKLGPVSVKGANINVQGWRLRTGMTYIAKPHSGLIHADRGTIDEEAYTIEIDTDDASLASTLSLGESSQITSGLTCYLRRIGVADAVASHIKVTASSGTYVAESLGGSGSGDATIRITVTLNDRPTVALSQLVT